MTVGTFTHSAMPWHSRFISMDVCSKAKMSAWEVVSYLLTFLCTEVRFIGLQLKEGSKWEMGSKLLRGTKQQRRLSVYKPLQCEVRDRLTQRGSHPPVTQPPPLVTSDITAVCQFF